MFLSHNYVRQFTAQKTNALKLNRRKNLKSRILHSHAKADVSLLTRVEHLFQFCTYV